MFLTGLTSTIKTSFKPDKKNAPDEKLILSLAAGDSQALAELYSLTDSAVYGFALSILKDHHAAEDVMQETYLKIIDSAHGYTPMGKPMAWILTIVKNLAFMKLRTSKGELSVPLDESFDLTDSSDFQAESADRMVLSGVVSRLNDEERQIVTLFAVSGLKHREISSVMGIPLPTVLSKYRRALAKLKKYMEEERNEK